MSKKTILFFIVVSVTIFSLAVMVTSYAGVPSGSQGASGPLGLGYEPGELLVRFAPKLDGTQHTLAECNEILTSIGKSFTNEYEIVLQLDMVRKILELRAERLL